MVRARWATDMTDEQKLPPGDLDRAKVFLEIQSSPEFLQAMKSMRDTRDRIILDILRPS